MPIAARACLPASPNAPMKSSLAPLATSGCSRNPGIAATYTVTCAIRFTRSRDPSATRRALMDCSAAWAAACCASATVTSDPRVPTAITVGSQFDWRP